MRLATKDELCSGCRACQLVCSLQNFGENNPKFAVMRIIGHFPKPGHYEVRVCDECGACRDVCPFEAIHDVNGHLEIDRDLCTGCQACVAACPLGVITMHASWASPFKCVHCGACAEYPTGAIYDADLYTPEQAWRITRDEEVAKAKAGVTAMTELVKGGYAGKILRVDLTAGTHRTQPLPADWPEKYIGGRGFVARVLYEEIPPGTDPLGPDNKLVMAAGPLTGIYLPGCGKTHFGAKSPATGGYGDANIGGHLSPELKQAGYDVLVLEGQAKEPVILVVDDDKVQVLPAGDLWGKGCFEAEELLKKRFGEEFQIAVIGPAGENLVKFACISHDFGRQAGRTGVGAVMGSKRVKAIVLHGTKSIPLADPKGVYELGKKMYESCFSKPGFKKWTPYGTPEVVDWVNEVGAFPTRNFKTSHFPGYKNINGVTMRNSIRINDKGCMGCPIPCGKYSKARTVLGEALVEGPEYETIALLGGSCCLGNIHEIAYANYICDDLGLDSISGGNVAAFAIECFEKGVLTEEQVGMPVAFGDLKSVVHLLKKIASREGVGDLLAEGVRTASQRLGHGSERYAIHVKGLEWTGYESRYAPAMMLSYITADIGAHHNRSWAVTYDVAVGRDKLEGKAEKVVELQHTRPLFDCLGICRLQWVEIGFDLDWYEAMYPKITGLKRTWQDLLRVSERVWNLNRAFSARHIPGFGRAMDRPPARFLEEPIPDGPAKGKLITEAQMNELLDNYYKLRGWTPGGLPTKERLVELGLDDVAVDLWG